MKLIADSGSTKTDWLVYRESRLIFRTQTLGINPYFCNSDIIRNELSKHFLPTYSSIDELYFYGAGVTDESKRKVIDDALCQIWPELRGHYYSDLIGAARASLGSCSGVVCILGTGSNAGFFNGHDLVEKCSPLGFILGDEGSGAVMGRDLVADFLKKVMPEDLRSQFFKAYGYNEIQVLDRVYRSERPNRFLAGFSYFLSQNIDSEYCREFVYNHFAAFIKRNVMMLNFSHSLPVSFVGSVAYHFQDILRQVLADHDLKIGKILMDPIDNLALFHGIKN